MHPTLLENLNNNFTETLTKTALLVFNDLQDNERLITQGVVKIEFMLKLYHESDICIPNPEHTMHVLDSIHNALLKIINSRN